MDAAVTAGRRETARPCLHEFEEQVHHLATAWARARAAHGHALLSEGPVATARFEEALGHHAQARRPFERARTELAYGEALRRSKRRMDARPHLQAALDAFDGLAAAPWAERAAAELRACGRTARRRDPSTLLHLTPQELQVARFVAVGLLGLLAGAAYLANVLPLGTAGDLVSGGIIPVANMAVALAVAAGFVLILSEFLEQTLALRGKL